MLKLQRISQFQYQFDFKSPEENFSLVYNQFLASDLGKIYSSIPWDELSKAFKLDEPKKGPTCIFSPKGKLALMFLKNYAGCSDTISGVLVKNYILTLAQVKYIA